MGLLPAALSQRHVPLWYVVAGVAAGVLLHKLLGGAKQSEGQCGLCEFFETARRVQGEYVGKHWSSPQTLSRQELAAYKRMRLEQHEVKTDKGFVVKDWLWVDTPDMVNIVVERAEDGRLLLFRQRKYGIDGYSLAVVGGLVDHKVQAITTLKQLPHSTHASIITWARRMKNPWRRPSASC
eukprot:scaffold1535_cov382-Prasinococcus_capsulatus_cf.AAC.40